MAHANDYDFEWVQGDTLPLITGTLYNGDGIPLDLRNGTVLFVLYDMYGNSLGTYPVTVVDAENGVISFSWSDGDTDALDGRYLARISVDWTNNDSVHVPSNDYYEVYIY